MKIHWIVIVLFILLHAGVRVAYLSAQNAQISTDETKTQTTIAPPMIRNIASVVTAVILAVGLYWLGFGIRYLST